MTDDKITYLTKGRNTGYDYNFDLQEHTKGFSFCKYCENAWQDVETGAVIVITSKQYIVTYTSDYGRGPHIAAQARIMQDLLGGGQISPGNYSWKLSTLLTRRYITARVDYYINKNDLSKKTGSGKISFNLNNKTFSLSEYFQFLEFYRQYNDDISMACKHYGLIVECTIPTDEGKTEKVTQNNLDFILNYIGKNISHKPIVYEDEVIIKTNKSLK